jgi:hypothetical protein
MTPNTTRHALIFLLFLVCCPIYSALADKLYQIEILVFEQTDKRGLSEEWWPENPGSPIISQATSVNFTPPKLLKRPGNLPILLHKAWEQPIGSAIHLTNQKDLEGIFSLNQNRFLHADMDLLWQKNMKVTRQKFGLLGLSPTPSTGGEEKPVIFRLRQSQKIKSNEIRYYDHPAFGAILIINTVEKS